MSANDTADIVNVVNLYALAVDSHRYELFDQVFTPDIHCDFGGGAAFEDRATLKSVFADIHAVFAATQHITSGHVVRVAGDGAHCFSYVQGRFRRRLEGAVEGAADALFVSTGWYDDVLARTPEGWRIRRRVSRMVSCEGDKRVMQAMPDVDTEYQLDALFAEADAGRIAFFA